MLFKGKKSLSEIKIWIDDFQSRVKKIAGNEYLQFTCKMFMPNASPTRNKQENVSDLATNTFPYLNLGFFLER